MTKTTSETRLPREKSDLDKNETSKIGLQSGVKSRPPMSDIWNSRWLPFVSTPLIVVVALTIWQLYIDFSKISPLVLPTPASVGEGFISLISNPDVWRVHISATMSEALQGFGLAFVVGVTLGYLTGKFAPIDALAKPFIVASQTIPKVALIPLFILWFGFGPSSKIAIAATLAFFPFVMNTSFGVRSIPPALGEMMTSLNVTPLQRFWKLELRYMTPHILTGAEMALVLSLIGAIVGEYLAGDIGLGRLAIDMQNNLMVPELYGSILIMTVLGFSLYSLVAIARRILIPWHDSVLVMRRGRDLQ